MEITAEILQRLPFRPFRKKTTMRARPLTAEDHAQKQGIIESLEGPEHFRVGDYLARGVQDEEWVIGQEKFVQTYDCVQGPDAEGFATYQLKDPYREAYQVPEPFSVRRRDNDILHGKAGDYLIRNRDSSKAWIVDRAVFEQSHEPVTGE